MLPIVSITKKLRDEGPGYGIPMTYIELGGSEELDPEDIVRTVLKESPKRSWVFIFGKEFDPLGMGIGTLVQGLSKVFRYVEIETDGLHRTPRWVHTADRWAVDYQINPTFNYGSLRPSDCIRIKIESTEDLEKAEEALENCKVLNCVKYLKFPGFPHALPGLDRVFKLAFRFERTRLYLVK